MLGFAKRIFAGARQRLVPFFNHREHRAQGMDLNRDGNA